MNQYQQQEMKKAAHERLSDIPKYVDATIWTLIWDIVDPSFYQSESNKGYAQDILISLIGTTATADILALMEGAKINQPPADDVVAFSLNGF